MSTVADSLARLRSIVQSLPPGLQDHLERVRELSLELAVIHKVDPGKVETAALGHDIYRAHSEEQLLSEARARGLVLTSVEERAPVLLHGPLAAHLLREECAVADEDVLQAVRWHSTSCPGMSRVGLVVFIADKVEPQKVERAPHLGRAAVLARQSLEQAAVEYLTAEVASLLQRGSLVHPASIEARNYLLMRL